MLYMPEDLKKAIENEMNTPPTISSPKYLVSNKKEAAIFTLKVVYDATNKNKPESPTQQPQDNGQPENNSERSEDEVARENELARACKEEERDGAGRVVAHSLTSIIIS